MTFTPDPTVCFCQRPLGSCPTCRGTAFPCDRSTVDLRPEHFLEKDAVVKTLKVLAEQCEAPGKHELARRAKLPLEELADLPPVALFDNTVYRRAVHLLEDYGTCIVHRQEPEKVSEILKNYWTLINKTPILLSLLYDVGMMPEQCVTVRAALSVAAVCEAYKAGKEGL